MPPTHILKTKYYLIIVDDLNAEAVEAVGIELDRRALFARQDSTLTYFSRSRSRSRSPGGAGKAPQGGIGSRRWVGSFLAGEDGNRQAHPVRIALARRPPLFASPYSTLTRANVRIARSPAS